MEGALSIHEAVSRKRMSRVSRMIFFCFVRGDVPTCYLRIFPAYRSLGTREFNVIKLSLAALFGGDRKFLTTGQFPTRAVRSGELETLLLNRIVLGSGALLRNL